MTTMAGINEFLDQKTLAVVGVSRTGKKFSNILYKTLKAKGFRLFAINPNIDSIDGEFCYKNIQSLREQVNGVVVVVPPKQTWLQQGAESSSAIDFCKKNGINVIHNQCILMFADPAFPHKFHRYVLKVLGRLPK